MLKGVEELKLFFHKNERFESDLSRPVPQISDPSQLFDVRVVEQFERMVKEIINTDDGETALLGQILLEDILFPQISVAQYQRSPIYARYQKMDALLKFMNLSVYGMIIITKTIRENFLTVLKAGVDVQGAFQFILDVYDDILLEGHIAQDLGEALIACEEKLGTFPLLKDGGKAVSPTVGNWLNEYLQMGLSGPEHRTGSIERIQFFKMNLNAQKLSEYDKQLLLKIFRFYDWLRYGEAVFEGESGPQIIQEETGDDYMVKQKFTLPQMGKPTVPPIPKQPSVGTASDLRPFDKTQDLRSFGQTQDLRPVATQEPKAAGGVGLTPPAGDIKQPFPPSSSTLPAPPSPAPSSRPLSADATGRGLPTKGEGIEGKGGKGEDRTLYQSPQAAPVQGAADRTDRLVVPPKDEKGERGVMGGMGMMGGMGEEEMGPQNQTAEGDWYGAGQGKGLKFGGDGQEKQSLIFNPSSLTKKPIPPVAPKPKVNIDQKLEELKKKAEKKNTNK